MPRPLPPELVLLILARVDSTDPNVQRNAYRMCCLASRAICDLAQPFLWRDLRFNLHSAKGEEKLLRAASAGEMVRHTRSLWLNRVPWRRRRAFEAASAFVNLERLVVRGRSNPMSEVKLPCSFLRPFQHLRHLTLVSLFFDFTAPLFLPHLFELRLLGIHDLPESSPFLFSHSTLPALRVLTTSARRGFTLPNDLLDRLDALQLHTPFLSHLPSDVRLSHVPKMLAVAAVYSVVDLLDLFQTTQVNNFGLQVENALCLALLIETLRDYYPIPSPAALPFAIFLPPPDSDGEVDPRVSELKRECGTRGIEVVHGQYERWGAWSVSVDFPEYARRFKRRGEEGKAAEL
ncbi:hypothetical protein JCM6882_004991 [Rhodosporidiobolus microsporus]